MQIRYRSSGLPAGFFNCLGTLHMHVDGAQDQELILKLVRELERKGNLGKLNHVDRFIAGPQRAILPEVYQSHTPELGGKEALEFFSTNALKNRGNAIETINFTGDFLRNTQGIIVEVEQPVMWLGTKGWSLIPVSEYINAIQPDEVKLTHSPSLEFEIHHGFDLPKEHKQVELDELGHFCEESDIAFGGWFVFEKPSVWAYRSNSFAPWEEMGLNLKRLVEREQDALNLFLQQRYLNVKIRTLVEKVIGIWKI